MTDNAPPVRPDNPKHLTRLQMRLMQTYIEDAIDACPEEARCILYARMRAGDLKITTDLKVAARPDGSEFLDLAYVVSTLAEDRYVEFAIIHADRLWITKEQYDEEVRLCAHLNGLGIPDDLSGLEAS